MNKQLRKAVIAGNWKMNKTPSEAKALLEEIKPLVKDAGCDVVVCVPYVDLCTALEATKGTNIGVGAENCHWAESGAFTGEISAVMLKEMGVQYVITGHSERRTYFGDTDVTVQKRTRAALDAGLTVIVCVGEYLEQREQGVTDELVQAYLESGFGLMGIPEEQGGVPCDRVTLGLLTEEFAHYCGCLTPFLNNTLAMRDLIDFGSPEQSEKVATISSTCTVFAESEVISKLSEGQPIPDIVAGIHTSVVERTAGLARRLGVKAPVVMTGGVALNKRLRERLADKLGQDIQTNEDSQLIGALGAALHALEKHGAR